MGGWGERGNEADGENCEKASAARSVSARRVEGAAFRKIAFFSDRSKTKNFFRTFLPRRREKKEEKNGEK
jgi:hypothetical protein